LEKEINTKNQPSEFILPHFYDPGRDEFIMENEIENGEEAQEEEEENEVEPETMPPRRSTRAPQPSTRLRDFVTYEVQYHIQNFISYEKITPEYKAFLSSISKETEPNSYQDAITNPIWCKTMNKELKALEKMGLGKLYNYPKERKP
jgi:hypothetical protein